MSTNDAEYELVEVPVQKKIEVNITLDDLLAALAQQANSLTSGANPHFRWLYCLPHRAPK